MLKNHQKKQQTKRSQDISTGKSWKEVPPCRIRGKFSKITGGEKRRKMRHGESENARKHTQAKENTTKSTNSYFKVNKS